MTITHIPLYIYYFIYKIKSIKLFIYKEMQKNNYLSKAMMIPPIKNKNKNITFSKKIKIKKFSSYSQNKKLNNDLINSSL